MDMVEELLSRAREAVQQHRPAEAEQTVRKILEITPDHYDALQVLGASCIHQGKMDEGITAMKRAAMVRPEDPKAQFNLGSAYALARRWNEANASFQVAIQLDPNYQKAREALSQCVHRLAEEPTSSGGRPNVYCVNHPDVMSADKCRQCGVLVCEDCLHMDYGTAFCERCYHEVVAQREAIARQRQAAFDASAGEQEPKEKKGGRRGLFGRKG